MMRRVVIYALLAIAISVAAGYTVWSWYDVAAAGQLTGEWFPRLAFLMPFAAVVGAGLLMMERALPGRLEVIGAGMFVIERVVPLSLDQAFRQRELKARKIFFGAIALGAFAGIVNAVCIFRVFAPRP